MDEKNKGVNTVVPEPPAATEPEKPAVPAQTPPAESVIPAAGEPTAPEAPAAPEPKDDNPMVPRGRLNEEIAKRHELEARLKALEDARSAPAPVVPTVPQSEPVDFMRARAEQMSQEAGKDEFGNDLLPVKAALVQLRTMAELQYASTAGTRLDSNVADFVRKNPRAAKYADRIREGLANLEPGVKDNPANVGRKYLELLGSDVENIEREAEERGKKKALEQKKIVGQAAGETPGGLPDGKSFGDMLSADEKSYADKHKMSYEEYHKAKSGKRV